MDAESYRKLLEMLERAEAVAGMRRGLDSVDRGEGRPAAEVLEEIRDRSRIPRSD